MPKCKKADCREQALPTGKRYCAQHKAEYLAKQKAYAIVQATLPNCSNCNVKLSKSRADAGETLCGLCAARAEREDAEQRVIDQREAALSACQTVEDLKGFIRDYLT